MVMMKRVVMKMMMQGMVKEVVGAISPPNKPLLLPTECPECPPDTFSPPPPSMLHFSTQTIMKIQTIIYKCFCYIFFQTEIFGNCVPNFLIILIIFPVEIFQWPKRLPPLPPPSSQAPDQLGGGPS